MNSSAKCNFLDFIKVGIAKYLVNAFIGSFDITNTLLFCCVLSIFALMKIVLIAMFCAAIKRDSVPPWLSPLFSTSSRVRIRLFVTWNTNIIVFLPIFCFLVIAPLILVLFLVAVTNLSLRCFLWSLRDVLSMYRRYLQHWWVLFLLFSLIHSAVE